MDEEKPFREDFKAGPFGILPTAVATDEALCANAKVLFSEIVSLCNQDGYCWASNNYIAEFFRWSASTVSRCVRQLAKRGYIVCEMAKTKKGSERRIYMPWGMVNSDQRGSVQNFLGGLRKTDETPIRYIDITENITENKPPIVPQGGKRARRNARTAPDWEPERFEGFWKFYPKEGRKDKQGAMDEWDKLRPDDALIRKIGFALKRQKQSEEWRRGIGIPYAVRYLRKRRWEDEVADVSSSDTGGWLPDREVL